MQWVYGASNHICIDESALSGFCGQCCTGHLPFHGPFFWYPISVGLSWEIRSRSVIQIHPMWNQNVKSPGQQINILVTTLPQHSYPAIYICKIIVVADRKKDYIPLLLFFFHSGALAGNPFDIDREFLREGKSFFHFCVLIYRISSWLWFSTHAMWHE